MFANNADIARRVYRALKTPSDDNPRTDPILAFHFKGKSDYIMMRCNKSPEISIKGEGQTAGEVKFFAYSDFADYNENNVLFKLNSLDENGVQISLKLPYLVYSSVRGQQPSMQNFIVEAIKAALRNNTE